MDGCSEEELSDKQRLLNVKYDAFVKQYGAITSKANRIAFRDDSDYPLLCSLEEVDVYKRQVVEALNESLGVVYRDVASIGKIVVIGRP